MREFFKPWRRMAGCVTLVIALVVIAFGTLSRGTTMSAKDATSMKQAIPAQVPIGTKLGDATKFMENEGFEWSVLTNHRFTGDSGGNREGLDFIYCQRIDQAGLLEIQVWGVALVFADSKVTEVLVRTVKWGM